jgi:hypothetical protein
LLSVVIFLFMNWKKRFTHEFDFELWSRTLILKLLIRDNIHVHIIWRFLGHQVIRTILVTTQAPIEIYNRIWNEKGFSAVIYPLQLNPVYSFFSLYLILLNTSNYEWWGYKLDFLQLYSHWRSRSTLVWNLKLNLT